MIDFVDEPPGLSRQNQGSNPLRGANDFRELAKPTSDDFNFFRPASFSGADVALHVCWFRIARIAPCTIRFIGVRLLSGGACHGGTNGHA